jgi:hypothetical protein
VYDKVDLWEDIYIPGMVVYRCIKRESKKGQNTMNDLCSTCQGQMAYCTNCIDTNSSVADLLATAQKLAAQALTRAVAYVNAPKPED